MKKIQTLLSGLAFLVTAAVVTAHAEEAAAETNAGLAKLLDFRIAIALFVVVGICLLVSLVIWRMPRSKAKGEKDSEGQEVSDKDLEALRISYGFWLVVGALLITLLVLVDNAERTCPRCTENHRHRGNNRRGYRRDRNAHRSILRYPSCRGGAFAGADDLGQHAQEPSRRFRAYAHQA